MNNFLQTLSFILPIIAVCYVLLILLVGLYLKIRRQFSIKVNCWFCNSWFKVPYDNRNSFNCQQCEQYNGFTEDGDYNRIIPEQHDELLNKSRQLINNQPNSNGLCNICNNNQVLKVIQLARFVPMVEENYDAEIEHFQAQLEKAYKLCKKCEKVLKNTLDTQNAKIFGNHIKDIQNKSLALLKQAGVGKISNLCWRIYHLIGILLTFTVLLQIIFINNSIYKGIINHFQYNYVFILRNLVNSLRVIQVSTVNIDSRILLYCFGLFLQLITTIKSKSFTQINRQLCWFLLLLSTLTKLQEYAIYVQLPVIGYLLLTSFIHESKPIKIITKSKKIRRKQQDRFYSDCSDDDDDVEIEDVSLSSTKSSSIDFIDSSCTLNKSTIQKKTTCEPLIHSELNKSLNNLHLGGDLPTIKPQQTPLQRPKPVLSPPKLTNIDNQILDNNFWRNQPYHFLSTTTTQQQQQQQTRTNLSRSSSESSGIGSQNNEFYNNYQYLNKTNLFGDHMERSSIFSEPPAYYFKPLNSGFPPPSSVPTRSFLRQEGAIFFPNLQHNNLLWIHGNFARLTTSNFSLNHEIPNWSERFNNNHNNSESLQNFRDLRLRSEQNSVPSGLFKINSSSI